ncbi:hypothetical protein ZHAS_00012563 [Anopheles sinensis]|uniref:Uncharacterized protein n=1 Tax=Anopheles sinensis TaxID=74873 RepID=A0A084W367_ANOSI|nr:hypothetical protein ZHAS_00012563 [Anopheles sinensis]
MLQTKAAARRVEPFCNRNSQPAKPRMQIVKHFTRAQCIMHRLAKPKQAREWPRFPAKPRLRTPRC